MKRFILISLIISLIIGSCTREKKSPIEGSWNLISAIVTMPDTVINYPLSNKGKHMKIVGRKYFSTIWQDETIDESLWLSAGFNGGTYTFEDGVYTENHTYFSITYNIGNKAVFKAEIKNDTLFLSELPGRFPEGYSSIEKWKRLE